MAQHQDRAQGRDNSEPIGATTVGRTLYMVRVIPRGPESRRALPNSRNYSLTGPNGAVYFVQDHGPDFRVVSLAMGGSTTQRWSPAPRPLRGLTRAHVAPFYDHPDHFAAEVAP